MEHFRNPRNVGEIKDASGIGKVGNAVCVIPGTMVLCNAERTPAENVTEKSRVLSHDGKYHRVKRVFKRPYQGKLYKIFVDKLGDITITPEHHILAVRAYKPRKKKIEYFADWFMASELKKRSTILFPVPKERDYRNYKNILSKWNKEYYYAKVKKIEELNYDGEVYNLEVDTTRSYVTECATLHNCGDIMNLYIKVEKDVIVDAKFKTFGCLPAETGVVAGKGGWNAISSIKKGDWITSSEGDSARVFKTFSNNYQGSLAKITPFVSPYNSFSATPLHPILCIKRSQLEKKRKTSNKCDWLRVDKGELKRKEPDYINAKDIEKSDYLVFAVNKEVKDNLKFTKDTMRLIGYYLSEGYIIAKGNAVAFAFNKNEKKASDDLKSLLKEITGKTPGERIRKNVREVYICSKKLAVFLKRSAGSLAKGKTLSKEIMLLPFDKQKELVKTYLVGDGNVYKRRQKSSFTYRVSTVSSSLAVQMQQILARGGIFASIKKIYKPGHIIGKRKLRPSYAYLVSFQLERKHAFVHKANDYFLVPVRKIERVPFEGRIVYNLQLATEPNTYLVKGFAVHNCGAAIATSSMVTELVKGKTVKEALEVSNHAVAEALGGLPRVKMHCSVLAESALKSAIEDYLKKHGKTLQDLKSEK